MGRTLAECNGLAAEAAGRELAAGNAAPRFAREVAAAPVGGGAGGHGP